MNGNPHSLLFRLASNGNVFAGAPSYFFFYDNQKRLIEVRKTHDDRDPIIDIHRYGYNSGSNRIATDTFISPDDLNGGYIDVFNIHI